MPGQPSSGDPASTTYPADWHATLPGFPVAGGALLFDSDDRLLLVKPVYKAGWEIPGGIAEAGDSPWMTCVREIREELGFDLESGRLLCVDWVPPEPGCRAMLGFVFDGGVLDGELRKSLRPCDPELQAIEFVAPDDLADRCSPRLVRRVTGALRARAAGVTTFMEAGQSVERSW
ncbi:NUDIX hydrolase [Kutzneria viridogrisea]|uniref:8-oxo-dGTP pyrophosphatase MutT (NUDIX family) n=1 Tax=Kutzneria viridogrisea TaxID=47990 RepID=A0ABR6BK28_9PSEU|nr:8-oxo-dGTP pyrophosphatase MutT (NUDIX family) [Kutzneria viridogrisea]